MRASWSFAFAGAATVVLLVACGGSSGVTIPSADPGDGSGTDASTTPPDGTDDPDSGIVCAPCETAPPDPACKGTGKCKCAPYTCPDAGGNPPPPDAGPDGATDNTCTWSANSNPCGPGKYCSTTTNDCTKGVCVAVGTLESPIQNAVCGCDGVTYWNNSVAAKRGMSVRKDGACTGNDARVCGGVAGTSCKGGTKCNLRVDSYGACAADVAGTCWATPSSCPLVGTPAKVCGKNSCQFECGLINNEEPWFYAKSCAP